MQRTEYQCSTVAAQEQFNDRRLQKRQEQVTEPDLDQQAVRLVEDCTPKSSVETVNNHHEEISALKLNQQL